MQDDYKTHAAKEWITAVFKLGLKYNLADANNPRQLFEDLNDWFDEACSAVQDSRPKYEARLKEIDNLINQKCSDVQRKKNYTKAYYMMHQLKRDVNCELWNNGLLVPRQKMMIGKLIEKYEDEDGQVMWEE